MNEKASYSALLTGGTGFLGSHILSMLLSEKIGVVLLKRSHSTLNNIKNFINNPFLKIYDVDLIDVKDVFNENKIDVIIHTATDYGRNGFLTEVLNSNLIVKNNLKIYCGKYRILTFRELESLSRFFLTEFFTFYHSWISC